MRVDRLDREKLFDRVGLDRRDGIDRGVVDEKIKTIDRRDERFALVLQARQINEIARGKRSARPVARSLAENRLRLGFAIGSRKVVQKFVPPGIRSRAALSQTIG